MVIRDVCFRAVAKFASTAEMRALLPLWPTAAIAKGATKIPKRPASHFTRRVEALFGQPRRSAGCRRSCGTPPQVLPKQSSKISKVLEAEEASEPDHGRR
jgi:hypothetical protein